MVWARRQGAAEPDDFHSWCLCPDTWTDEKMIEQMDWILNWCKHNAQTEIFARSVQNWDRELGETPTFWFLDENTMSKARAKTIEDDS